MRLGQHLEKIGGTDDVFLQGKAAAYGQRVVVVSGVVGVDGGIVLFGGSGSISGLSVISGCVRGPQGQVVTQKLHDQRWVLVAILVKGVQLGNSLIEGLKN